MPFHFHNLISALDLLRNMTALDKDNFSYTIRLFHDIYHSKNLSVLHIFRAHQFESYGCQTQYPIHTTFLLHRRYKNACVSNSSFHIGHQNVTFNSSDTKISVRVPVQTTCVVRIYGNATEIKRQFLPLFGKRGGKKRLKERNFFPSKVEKKRKERRTK